MIPIRTLPKPAVKPFLDTSVFTKFQYGNVEEGRRIIDAQYATCTKYVSTTMHANETMFGVNFADGRIKGYPSRSRRGEGRYFVLYCRGNPAYGKNRFQDNGDGTVTDEATGLTWMQSDSGKGMNWPAALDYAARLEFAGHDDWRLPTAKELQSIVDYTRSPDTTDSAAIDPVFRATEIVNEAGEKDFGWYWTNTSHCRQRGSNAAAYLAFGRAGGFMGKESLDGPQLLDVHGAGAQRSDPKVGDASRFPTGRGPQGDVIRIDNLVRCVPRRRSGTGRQGPPLPQQNLRPSRPRPPGGDAPTGAKGKGKGKGKAKGSGKGKGDGSAAAPGRTGQRLFGRFDENSDGIVNEDEFDGPGDRFNQMDRNGDGKTTVPGAGRGGRKMPR